MDEPKPRLKRITLHAGRWYVGFEFVGGTYYLYPFNWLGRGYHKWGREHMYYDGPHECFNFWLFNVTWRLPWRWTISPEHRWPKETP